MATSPTTDGAPSPLVTITVASDSGAGNFSHVSTTMAAADANETDAGREAHYTALLEALDASHDALMGYFATASAAPAAATVTAPAAAPVNDGDDDDDDGMVEEEDDGLVSPAAKDHRAERCGSDSDPAA